MRPEPRRDTSWFKASSAAATIRSGSPCSSSAAPPADTGSDGNGAGRSANWRQSASTSSTPRAAKRPAFRNASGRLGREKSLEPHVTGLSGSVEQHAWGHSGRAPSATCEAGQVPHEEITFRWSGFRGGPPSVARLQHHWSRGRRLAVELDRAQRPRAGTVDSGPLHEHDSGRRRPGVSVNGSLMTCFAYPASPCQKYARLIH